MQDDRGKKIIFQYEGFQEKLGKRYRFFNENLMFINLQELQTFSNVKGDKYKMII